MPIDGSGKLARAFFGGVGIVSTALLSYQVLFVIRFTWLPLAFFLLGFVTAYFLKQGSLRLFLFLLPVINSLPDLFFNGYPYNYMALPLFYLVGLLLAAICRKEKPQVAFPGRGTYALLLALMAISLVFVFLRWSNIALSRHAFLADTPVSPAGHRLSFAAIFPLITISLFAVTPWITALLKKAALTKAQVCETLLAGYTVSFTIALAQKYLHADLLTQSWWGRKLSQVNGGFSDFNAMGFFSGALFLGAALSLFAKGNGIHRWRSPRTLLLLFPLLGIFLSGVRTALLFPVLGLLYLLWRSPGHWRKKVALLSIMLTGLTLLFLFSPLGQRLGKSVSHFQNLARGRPTFRMLDSLTSGRLTFIKDSMRIVTEFPVCGVGTGNFLFYFQHLNVRQPAYEDLPLNQYLLITDELGVVGLCVFLIFLGRLITAAAACEGRIVLGAVLAAIFFNNYFWFGECLILFWILVHFFAPPLSTPRRRASLASIGFAALTLTLYLVAQIVSSPRLEPWHWLAASDRSYDYGLWANELDPQRGVFFWTQQRAGLYVHSGLEQVYLYCGAPRSLLCESSQRVQVFWHGRPYRSFSFTANAWQALPLPPQGEGLLEFVVDPVFNMRRLGIGADPRNMGVQVHLGWRRPYAIPLETLAISRPQNAKAIRGDLFLSANTVVATPAYTLPAGRYEFIINASGTPVKGENARLRLAFAGQRKNYFFYLQKSFKNYAARVAITSTQACRFLIAFENNAWDRLSGEDRNVWLRAIFLKKIE